MLSGSSPTSVLPDGEVRSITKPFLNRAGALSSLACGLVSLLDLALCLDAMLRFFDGAVPGSYIVLTSLRLFDLL